MQQQSAQQYYQEHKDLYQKQFESLSKKHSNLSLLRLAIAITVIVLTYFYIESKALFELIGAVALALAFVYLMKIHQKVTYQKTFSKTLLKINSDELAFLQGSSSAFADGAEFKKDNHAYSSDLDLFGSRSLFQYLNRTATQMGKEQLADNLEHLQSPETILERQSAVQELSTKTDERQAFYALGKMAQDHKDIWEALKRWTKEDSNQVSKPVLVLAYVLPFITICTIGLYLSTKNEAYWGIINKIIPINIILFSGQLKRIKRAIFSSEKINEMLKSYGRMLQQIESQTFESKHLQDLQATLKVNDVSASMQIGKLGRIFANMETVLNPFSAFIMNGFFLYHIHQWNSLNQWKKNHAAQLIAWLDVIGTLEMLNSLANLKFNNPSFSFPSINDSEKISFKSLGHPMIREEIRVCNDVSFEENRFIILTGSNMSGKSTFLRTLGVNMVLGQMGAVICATSVNLHALPIFVSMRQSDSLADSESYFFAEVKRLKFIMDSLRSQTCFVLLDEILRGTNSDDKRSGTIGVIEKIIRGRTIGAIATHDLEVCHTTDLHAEILTNQCFEVEIINNELVFDYKLRPGICRNKSATFLMKKMEII